MEDNKSKRKHCYIVMSAKEIDGKRSNMVNSVCMYCQSQDPPILRQNGQAWEDKKENCYTKKEVIDYILTTDNVYCDHDKWDEIFSKEELSDLAKEDPEGSIIDLNIEGLNKQLKLSNI